MADLGTIETTNVDAGLLSRQARMQYGALAWIRWRMVVNGLRSIRGLFELGATGIAAMVYGLLGIGMGAGLGAGAYLMVSRGEWPYVPVLFWVLFVLWQTLPLAVTSMQQSFTTNGLLRFPVSFESFYLLHLIFGLADVSTILGAMCSLGIFVGVGLARPGLLGWLAVDLVLFGAFNVVLVRAVLSWIERWLMQRRTREILGAVYLLLVLSLQLLNPALHQNGPREKVKTESWVTSGEATVTKGAEAVQTWLPPGLAGVSLERAGMEKFGTAWGMMGALGVYVLLTGGVLGWRLRAEYRGENLGDAPARDEVKKHKGRRLLNGSGPIAAVMEKELQTIVRSTRLLFGLGVPVLMVLVIASLLRNGGSGGEHGASMRFSLPLCEAYALMGFTQLIYNVLGTEGSGIQLIFLSSTPMRTVLLAKNLFHALLFGIVAVLAGVLACARVGVPDGPILTATACWVLFALPVNLAAGDVLSLVLPYRVDLGRMMRQAGSQGNALFAMLIQSGILGVGGAVYAACAVFGHAWLAAPILLVLAGMATFVWTRVLDNADAMTNRRRESLLSLLARTE